MLNHLHGPARRALLTGLALCGSAVAALPAAAQDPAAQPGADLTVYLATFGPGDQVWEKFGHNAIWIHDRATGSTISYNYGMFEFDQPGFVPRLMAGRMLYSMGVRSADDDVALYTYINRSITAQRLNLPAAARHELREFLEWNWLPENRDYLYDYFRDNCSTRLRDALDRVLGGLIRSELEGMPTGETYRSHSLRLTAESHGTYTGLLLGLGMPTDVPIDAWQESFIPMELMRHMRAITVTGEDGRAVPLVAEENVLYDAARDPVPDTAPARTHWYLLLGLLLATIFVVLAVVARTRAQDPARRPRVRLALGVLVSFWALVTGFFGLILALLWIATDHTAAYPNLNLLQTNPVGLLLAAAGPLALARRDHALARLGLPLALLMLVLSAAGLVLALLPAPHQVNGPIIALVLPVHAAVVFSLYHVRATRPSSGVDTRAAQARPAAA